MDDDRTGAGGPLKLGGAGPDERVDDGVERGQACGVGEDDRAERGPVQGAVGAQYPGAECLDDGREPGGAGLDDLAGDPVGVDEYGAEAREQS